MTKRTVQLAPNPIFLKEKKIINDFVNIKMKASMKDTDMIRLLFLSNL
jgi:hypothetical protein